MPSDVTRYHLILFIEPLRILLTIRYGNYVSVHVIPLLHTVTHALFSPLESGQLWTGDHIIHLFIARAKQSIIGIQQMMN